MVVAMTISTKAFHSATNRVLKQTKECMKTKLGNMAFRTKLKAICCNDEEMMKKIFDLFNKHYNSEQSNERSENLPNHNVAASNSRDSSVSTAEDKNNCETSNDVKKSSKTRKKYKKPLSLHQQLEAQKRSGQGASQTESIRYEYWEPDEETLAQARAVFEGDYERF